MLEEATGVQLTDKYDLYDESCEYYNKHTLFHKNIGEIQSKQKMIQDAEWKYKHRNRNSKREKGLRVGLFLCILLLFIIGTLIIADNNNAAAVFGCIIFYLIGICLFICFLMRTNDYINQHGLNCCKKQKKESMLNIDDFKINFMKSSGLYFDEKRECVYDIQILVNYSENTENEIIYIQKKKKLFQFDSILEIGFNETTNEYDLTQYGRHDSLPSMSHTYNRNDVDYRTLIIKYEHDNDYEPSTSISQSQSQSLSYTNNINIEKYWKDHKLTKREFNIKILKLKQILNLLNLSDTILIREQPYKSNVLSRS